MNTKMKVDIRLFATLRERAGAENITVQVNQPATVETLLLELSVAYPALEPALSSSLVAVNKAYSGPGTPIHEGDEIALFPPVSGGETHTQFPTFFSITSEEIDLAAIHRILTRADVGALISFTGSVRGQTTREGYPEETIQLEYEAYDEMALERLSQIAREIWERWPMVKGIAIVQRIGTLRVGDTTTVVVCAAGHRDQGAFEAARYGIDRLKEIVPVWKKEVSNDSSIWVEGSYRPTENDN